MGNEIILRREGGLGQAGRRGRLTIRALPKGLGPVRGLIPGIPQDKAGVPEPTART